MTYLKDLENYEQTLHKKRRKKYIRKTRDKINSDSKTDTQKSLKSRVVSLKSNKIDKLTSINKKRKVSLN